jgi:hypothetical protein
MKFYTIEQIIVWEQAKPKNRTGEYRFRSLFNGSVGVLRSDYDSAVADGEDHKRLLMYLFGREV